MKPRSLNFWLTAYLGAAWLILLLGLGIALWQSVNTILERLLAERSRALATQLATVSADAVLLRDYGSLERSVQDLARIGGVNHVVIRRADGVVLGEAGPHLPDVPVQRVPIAAAGEVLGEVAVQYDSGPSRTAAWQLTALVAVGLALFSVFAFWALRRLLIARLITPVRTLLAVDPHAVGGGAPAEVLELGAALNDLQTRLNAKISALDDAAQERNEALRRLCSEQRLATVGQMAGEVAHELNTPLSNILVYAQMAQSRSADAALRQDLETIVGQARRAGHIVRDMLNAARAPGPVSQELDLAALTEGFRRLFNPLARKQGVELTVVAEAALTCLADTSRIEQILFNLVSNAVQAGAKKVVLAVRQEDRPVLEVIDDGAGLPAWVRNHLFEPFVTTKPAGQGTGLGLAISQRLAREMGAELTLSESAQGRTVFRLAFGREGGQ